MLKKRAVCMASLLTLLLSLAPASALAEEGKLILATTTSTADSGLLDYILPDFEAIYNVKVDVIAVGTGQALKLAEAGDADAVLVHARSQEDAFVESGYGVNRQDVMYNDFIIVGPSDDPAGIKGMKDVAQAFSKIAETKSTFISRGDESGTHVKEKSIWAKVGLEPKGEWYISAGQGMGEVLTMAEEQMAYTLSDRATYLSRTIEGIDLAILVEGDPILFNPYGLIAVNPELHLEVNYDLAMAFIDWMTSVQVQLKISQFRHPSGETLFYPNSEAWRKAQEIK